MSAKAKRVQRLHRRVSGLCVTCGAPVVFGKSKCQVHLDYFAEYMRSYRKKRRPCEKNLRPRIVSPTPPGGCLHCHAPLRGVERFTGKPAVDGFCSICVEDYLNG